MTATNQKFDPELLLTLSRLFTYPKEKPGLDDLKIVFGDEKLNNDKIADFSKPEGLTSLQTEYVRLFINALPEVTCPPYGSFYLEGLLMGQSTVELNKVYSDYGMLTDEMPDHIAVELEFLGLLSSLPADDAIDDDYIFLVNHLRSWTPDFFEQVEKNDESGFYRELTKFTKGVIL